MIDWDAAQSDKFIGTTAAILSAIAAGVGGGAAVYGANKQAGAAQDAARLQTDAANHSADLQSKSTADALAFQKQQAENEWLNSQNTQRANYDQSKARYGSIAGVASQYGLNLGAMPDYAPGIDPHYTGGGGMGPGSIQSVVGGTSAPGQTDPNAPAPGTIAGATPGGGDPILDAVAANYKSLGVTPTGPGTGPTDAAYMAQKIKETGGLTPQNTSYWFGTGGRIAQELAKAKGGAAQKAGTIAAASPYMSAPTMSAPAVNTAIPSPYQPGTIGAYRGRA